MNIIIGKENLTHIDDRYIILELDSFKVADSAEPVNAYCVLENIPLHEMLTLKEYKDLHDNLIKNYKKRNWKFCLDALEHLQGKWNGELDSFYSTLQERVARLQDVDLPTDWAGVIEKV